MFNLGIFAHTADCKASRFNGPETCPPGGTTFDPKSTFGSLLKYIALCKGPKNGTSASWIWCLHGDLFDAPIRTLRGCWNQSHKHQREHIATAMVISLRVSKSLLLGAKNEPSGEVLSQVTETSSNVETLPQYIAKFQRVQCNFFRVGNRTCTIS